MGLPVDLSMVPLINSAQTIPMEFTAILSGLGLLPDGLVSRVIDRRIDRVLHRFEIMTSEELERDETELSRRLSNSELAVSTTAANEQHYEVPAPFFEVMLGPRLKYSSAFWPEGVNDLAMAEEEMLSLTAERAGLADGQDVLELGCGWGSLCLWVAEHFPGSRVLAVTNSQSQREFVRQRATARGLGNLEVTRADVNQFNLPPHSFDRVVSVEMFEHMKNYPALFARIGDWLRPGGKLFVHVFCHRRYAYEFDAADPGAWMARRFFTGGTMPSLTLLPSLCRNLILERRWEVNGLHYARTLQAWLDRLDASKAAARAALAAGTAAEPGRFNSWRALGEWRLFLLACRQTFTRAAGDEYMVAHYRWRT